jgi:two-component system, NtrC family, sensor histidine kinase KinB
MLRTRLTFGLLPLLLLFLAVCLYAIHTSQKLGISVEIVLSRDFRSIRIVQEMRDAVTEMNTTLHASRRSSDPGLRRQFDQSRTLFKRCINDELINQPTPEKTQLLNALDENFERFARAGEDNFRMGGLATLELLTRASQTFFAVNHTLDELLSREHHEILMAEKAVKARIDASLRLLMIAMVAAVILFFFLSWRLADSLLRPIQTMTRTAVALGDGDLDQEVPVTSRDELGQLAKAFNQMAVRLRAYRDATLAKVLRTQRTMEATLTSQPDPVFVVARDGSHEVRNPAAEQLVASTDFAPGFPAAIAESLANVLATGEHYLPTDYSCVVTLRVGREDRHYLPRILAIGDKLTEFKGAAVVLQDVTKFRLLDDAKTNLVGTVSHELKTPLTSLRMAVYLLLEQKIANLSSTQRELLEGARDDADRLLRILDNLLDLARLEAGASTLDRREIAVGPMVEEIAREARPMIEATGKTLVTVLDPGTAAALVQADSARLRHVFMNLLTNASKYAPAGSVVTLSAGREQPGFLRFSVRDQGAGIAAEVAARVFERFYRVPGETKPGAGLGLAIAREIVVAHGGTITCTAAPGGGSDFIFLLPG